MSWVHGSNGCVSGHIWSLLVTPITFWSHLLQGQGQRPRVPLRAGVRRGGLRVGRGRLRVQPMRQRRRLPRRGRLLQMRVHPQLHGGDLSGSLRPVRGGGDREWRRHGHCVPERRSVFLEEDRDELYKNSSSGKTDSQ